MSYGIWLEGHSSIIRPGVGTRSIEESLRSCTSPVGQLPPHLLFLSFLFSFWTLPCLIFQLAHVQYIWSAPMCIWHIVCAIPLCKRTVMKILNHASDAMQISGFDFAQ